MRSNIWKVEIHRNKTIIKQTSYITLIQNPHQRTMSQSLCPTRALTPIARKAIALTKKNNGKEYYHLQDNTPTHNGCTIHTHPNGVRIPSETDITTSIKMNRPCLCIALVPTNEVICYHISKNRKVKKTCSWKLWVVDVTKQPKNGTNEDSWYFQ